MQKKLLKKITKHKTQNTKHKTQNTKHKTQNTYIQKGNGLHEDYDKLLINYMKQMYDRQNKDLVKIHEMYDQDILLYAVEHGANLVKICNFDIKIKQALLDYQGVSFRSINKLLWNAKILKYIPSSHLFSLIKLIYEGIKTYGFKYDEHVIVFRIFNCTDDYCSKLKKMTLYTSIEYNSFISTSAIQPLKGTHIAHETAKIIIPSKINFVMLSTGDYEYEILLNPCTLLKIEYGTETYPLGVFIYIPIINEDLLKFLEEL